MAECEACRQLIGSPAEAQRHGALTAFTGRKAAHGWHEMYMCQVCGTRLQRVVPEPGSKGAGEPWAKAG